MVAITQRLELFKYVRSMITRRKATTHNIVNSSEYIEAVLYDMLLEANIAVFRHSKELGSLCEVLFQHCFNPLNCFHIPIFNIDYNLNSIHRLA